MKKALRAGILAAALAASSVTVVNAPVVFAAEGDAAAVGTGNEAVTTAGTGTDGAGKTDQPAKTELDLKIEKVEADLADAIALRDQAQAALASLQAALEGKAEPSPELKKAYEDAKAAENAKKREYDAAKSKLESAQASRTQAKTKLDEADTALASAKQAVADAETELGKIEAEGSEKTEAAKKVERAKSSQAAAQKKRDDLHTTWQLAEGEVILAQVAYERVSGPYADAQIATKTAETRMKKGTMSPAEAAAAVPMAIETVRVAGEVVAQKQAELNKLKAKKENQGKGSSLPAFKDGEKLTPFGIAVIVVSALVAVLGLGAALLPQLKAFLPQLPF